MGGSCQKFRAGGEEDSPAPAIGIGEAWASDSRCRRYGGVGDDSRTSPTEIEEAWAWVSRCRRYLNFEVIASGMSSFVFLFLILSSSTRQSLVTFVFVRYTLIHPAHFLSRLLPWLVICPVQLFYLLGFRCFEHCFYRTSCLEYNSRFLSFKTFACKRIALVQ